MSDVNTSEPNDKPEEVRPKRRERKFRHHHTIAQLPTVQVLTDAGFSQKAIAEKTGLTERTIGELQHDVQFKMRALGPDMVDLWAWAAKRAAGRGDEGPARRLLESAKLIEPVQATSGGPGVQVLVGVSLPGMPGAPVGTE